VAPSQDFVSVIAQDLSAGIGHCRIKAISESVVDEFRGGIGKKFYRDAIQRIFSL